MPNQQRSNWILRAAGIAAAVVVFISTTIGLYLTIENKITDSMTKAMTVNLTNVTTKIHQSTLSLAEMHKDDLEVRLRVKKAEMAEYEHNGEQVPQHLMIEVFALEDQIREVEQRWFAQ